MFCKCFILHVTTALVTKLERCRYWLTEVGFGLRLVGGETDREGVLEVSYDGVWGSVCDDGFNNIAAGVACRELGLG